MVDIYKSSETYYTGFTQYISNIVREKSGDVGGVHGRCIDCNRKLSDEHSTLIGRGPICRSKNSLRYTMIPNVWPGPPALERLDVYREDFHSTLDHLEETLDIDFVVLCGVDDYCIFKRMEKSPYDWAPPKSKDEILRLSLLDEHEYVQHNLMTCTGGEQDTDFNTWNKLVIVSQLECGMNPKRSEVIPRRFEHYDEADYPVCDKHRESWHDDIRNRTDPGCPAYLAEETQREIWHNCEECNYRHDERGDETVYLGSLGVDVLLTGEDGLPNPYMTRGYSRSRHGNAANYQNARGICKYFTSIQAAWENHFASHDLDSYEEWIDLEPSRYIWDTGERNHPGIGTYCGRSSESYWHMKEESRYEQAIWDFIAGSIYYDLDIDDFANMDDMWYTQFFPSVDGVGLPPNDAKYNGGTIEPAPKDEIWNKKMNDWFDDTKAKSRGYLQHWQQLERLQWIIPNPACVGEWTGTLPIIDNSGKIVSQSPSGTDIRYHCKDAYDCEAGVHERTAEGDIPMSVDYSRQITGIIDDIVKANKAKERGNVQTATPPSN
tara:strand:+ start:1005 stop:2648 length:1644 start_codon:yes stop_codon:yes gene_type:complete